MKFLYLSFFFFQSCTISASPSRIYVGEPFLLSVSVFSQDNFFLLYLIVFLLIYCSKPMLGSLFIYHLDYFKMDPEL